MDALNPDLLPPASIPVEGALHILSGSFRSLSLFLLAFSPLNKTLSHVQTISAYGPHQFLARNARNDCVYTTSWALPPVISSWRLDRAEASVKSVHHLNSVPITATSSYISIPPPFTHIYSAGGPTGEVHLLGPETGTIGERLQEFLFVPEEELESADKTRVALRYGSHGIEFSSLGYAFIPVLGTNTIEMYRRDPLTGHLQHLSSSPSPRGRGAQDGPRHVKVHPNGKILYCVTEHTNYVDMYRIAPSSLTYLASRSLLPPDNTSAPVSFEDPHTKSEFRGDTLSLTPPTQSNPAPVALLTTTRGATNKQRGWLSIFRLDADGSFAHEHVPPQGSTQGVLQAPESSNVIRFQTPTSGGKANAIEVRRKSDDSNGHWILITDDDPLADERGAVRVLEWDGWESQGNARLVAEWPAGPSRDSGNGGQGQEQGGDEERVNGASHAIWLD